ncbi:AAA domain-containing protein [Halobacteria archaeon HArc-gm2]|nr:AAA domain-containing protein [Halobacteria archaeon HArc-gm2]
MDDNPFNGWSRSDGTLLRARLDHNRGEDIPVQAACNSAVTQLFESTDDDQYAIPLFEADAPKPTDEYVYYRPSTEEIKFHDKQNGIRWVSTNSTSNTTLGRRLRWWLSDEDLGIETLDDETLPPKSVSGISSLSKSGTNSFFAEMRSLVQREQDTERNNNREKYENSGLKTAIARGFAVGPLLPTGTAQPDGNRVYKFQLVNENEEDDSDPNLRDDACIFPDNEYIGGVRGYRNQDPFEFKAVYVGDTNLWLRPLREDIHPNSARDNSLTDNAASLWVAALLNPLPYTRRLEAISKVKDHAEKRHLINGKRTVKFSADKYAVPHPEIELNDSQTKALVWANAAEQCLCIHGPPGTGKTRTLTAYIRDAVAKDNRVLVTAHSNQAVDNLLVGDSTLDEPEDGTLHAMAQAEAADFTIARAGSNSENPIVKRHYENNSLSGANIVAATTNGASKFATDNFDIGIVDEATQASRAATTIVFNASKKLILAGDHKQLPPFAASQDALGDEQRLSLFETLMNRYGDNIAVMLRTQYRMNEAIAEFPNEAFYDGKLITADQNRDWTVDDLSPLMGINIKGTEQSRSADHSYYNPDEAEAAVKQVKLLTISGLSPSDIGVIAAYSAQVQEIKQQLNESDIDRIHEVTVNTVDAFQGGEREAIIVSLVRSNSRASSGFLTIPDEGPRRLNVALTRARKRLVIIADWETLGDRASHRDPDESCAELHRELAAKIREEGKMMEANPQSET